MKPLIAGLCAVTLLSLLSFPVPVQAQARTSDATHANSNPDVPKELTLRGTVSGVLTKSSPGMIPGSHLLLSTASGPVDASLGRFALQGLDALSVTAGDEVEVTGIVRTLRNMQVFLVCTVTARGHVYLIRNKHGVPLSPQTRQRLSTGQEPARFGRGL